MQSVSNFANIAWETIKRGALQARFYLAAATTWVAAQQPLIIAAIIILAATVVTLLAISLWPRSKKPGEASEEPQKGKKGKGVYTFPPTEEPNHGQALQLAVNSDFVEKVSSYHLINANQVLDVADVRARSADGDYIDFYYFDTAFEKHPLVRHEGDAYFLKKETSRNFTLAVEKYITRQAKIGYVELYNQLLKETRLDAQQLPSVVKMLIHNLCEWPAKERPANIVMSLRALAIRFPDCLKPNEPDPNDSFQDLRVTILADYNAASGQDAHLSDFFAQTAGKPEKLQIFLSHFSENHSDITPSDFRFRPNDPLLDDLQAALTENRGFTINSDDNQAWALPALQQVIDQLVEPFGSTMLIPSVAGYWRDLAETLISITDKVNQGEDIPSDRWNRCILLLKLTMYQFNDTVQENPIKPVIKVIKETLTSATQPALSLNLGAAAVQEEFVGSDELLKLHIGLNSTKSIMSEVTKTPRQLPDLIGTLQSLANGETLTVTAAKLFPLTTNGIPPATEGIQDWGSMVPRGSSTPSESGSHPGSELDGSELEESFSGSGRSTPSQESR